MLPTSRLLSAARLVPLPLAARLAEVLFEQVLQSHPKLFDRLGEYGRMNFAFVPTDLPFSFCIRPSERTIRTLRRRQPFDADATITGPLPLMLALAEGRVDGDALFFARRLVVDGDMEAVLALRNALDDNGIDIVKSFGRLSGPAVGATTRILEAFRRGALESQGVRWN